MKWRKLGQLYSAPGAGEWAATHGQVPFAHKVDDVVHVFFTPKDRSHRSHIALMILDLDQLESRRVQSIPVMVPGRSGTFDDDGVMVGSIVDTPDGPRAYYQGWNPGGTVSFRTAVGLASIRVAGEQVVFERAFDGPILDRAPEEPFFLGTPFVRCDEDGWRMWYTSGTGWDEDGEPSYGIRHARSADGLRWVRDRDLCLGPEPEGDRMLTRPSVIKDGSLFRMWYSVRRKHAPYRIGYAESNDGSSWTRRDDLAAMGPSDRGWDSEMVCYPHVFDSGDTRYMLYCGNAFGRLGFGLAVLVD
jgi:hypothetical protein